jgi:hypothetical protein
MLISKDFSKSNINNVNTTLNIVHQAGQSEPERDRQSERRQNHLGP